MSRKYRVGIVGFAHMHINGVAGVFAKHPSVEWAGCADTVPAVPERSTARYTRAWNKEHVMKEFGVPREYPTSAELLEQGKPDIVIVCSENRYHPDIVEACAAAGVHACVEKPMAMSFDHGLRMVRAVESAKTTLAINWPIAWSPLMYKLKALLEQGVIGDVLQVKYRAGHTGPLGPGAAHVGGGGQGDVLSGEERAASWWHRTAEGGGALIDFCCYGAMLSRWLVGEQALDAVAVKANLDSHWGEADDNAVMITRFPSAIGLYEGTWTTRHHGVPVGPIVYGTEGTVLADSRDGERLIRLERGHGETEWIEPDPLPEGRRTIAQELVHHLDTGDSLNPLLAVPLNLDALAILDAGVRSADSGEMERIRCWSWPS